MKRRRSALAILIGLCVGVGESAQAQAEGNPINVGGFSTQISPGKAGAGVHISVQKHKATASGSRQPARYGPATPGPAPVILTLPADSPRLKDQSPVGPGSLWYQAPQGQICIYVPHGTGLCFIVVAPGHSRVVNVADVAAQLSEQMEFGLAAIEASPAASRDGLTGDQSWFWLADAPSQQQHSITLAGETVTVTADPSQISWSFGDGESLDAGAGSAYRAGTLPADAITHVYQTRCLAGDQGHDPYVLASCASDGYHVLASTTWTISFSASGPVRQSGALPSRTTQSQLVYPVSEARGFLTGGSQ